MVAKATYDPELEKQLAEERKRAREARTEYRKGLEELRKKNGDLVIQYRLTPFGASESNALLKTASDWVTANPEATSDEITDKGQELLDKLGNIYTQDANRLYFFNVLKVNEMILTSFKTNNVISEDAFKKSMEIVDRERKWLEKNPNESLQTYKEKLEASQKEIFQNLPPDAQQKINDGQKNVKMDDNTKEIEDKKRKAELLAKEKEQKEKAEFNPTRLFKKGAAGMVNAFWIALVLAFAVLGGSLAANEAVIRPLPFRILYFIYGFIFFPFVILFFVFRYFLLNKPPYFASILFPLYEYDPSKITRNSFFERLVFYKANPIIAHAQKTFQEAAEAVKDLKVDFTQVAAKIVEGK